jgi:hypothetical protein
MYKVTLEQITAYEQLGIERNKIWSAVV